MPKRKATEEELTFGIGEAEVDEEGFEVEEADDEMFTGFAAEDEEEDE